MIDVFISYASENKEEANSIFDLLKSSGYRPWMDKRNLIPGQRWNRAIEDGLNKSDVVIFLLSSYSVGKRGFFQREMNLALEKAKEMLSEDIFIVPVMLDSCECPDALKEFQWLDFTTTNAKNLLLKSLFTASEQRGVEPISSGQTGDPIVKDTIQLEEISERGDFEISCEFPEFYFPNDSSLSQEINNILSGDVHKSVFRFRSLAKDSKTEFSGNASTLHMVIQPTIVLRNLISLDRKTYEYWNGAAHGNSGLSTININVQEKSFFALSDLLDQNEKLVRHIFQKIASFDVNENSANQDFRPDPIASERQITDSIEESLSHSTSFSVDGIKVHFDPYEIHCYAFGPFFVDISYATLAKEFYNDFSPKGRAFIASLIR